MTRRWPLRIVVGSLFVVTLLASVVGLGHGPASATRLMYVGVAATWLAVALTVIERLPGHRIGQVMLVFGGLMAFYVFWDVDIESVTRDLGTTVHGALRPTHQGLWIRGGTASGGPAQ